MSFLGVAFMSLFQLIIELHFAIFVCGSWSIDFVRSLAEMQMKISLLEMAVQLMIAVNASRFVNHGHV